MNLQKRFDMLIKIFLSFLVYIPLNAWTQTPFNFAEIRTAAPNKKVFNVNKQILIPLRPVYNNEEKRGVYYFTLLEQKNAEVLIKKGLFYKDKTSEDVVNQNVPSPLLLPNIIPPPSVDKAQSLGYAIFVFDQNQKLYISFKAQPGKIHHSSLLAGRPVLCAGEMLIFQGQLKYINNRSGHYQPPPKSLKRVLEFLEKQGVDLKKVRTEFIGIDL